MNNFKWTHTYRIINQDNIGKPGRRENQISIPIIVTLQTFKRLTKLRSIISVLPFVLG